jgi:hypothetical protein
VATDWTEWHEAYADPSSSLARRLDVVRNQLARILDERRGRPTRLVSLCSGDGRDTLPVLAAGHRDVSAVLVELDPELAGAARTAVRALGLEEVEVRVADAGTADTVADVVPADVLMLCGIFGNVLDDDVRRTVSALSGLLTPGARVIWTRGRRVDPDPTEWAGDPSEMVRRTFSDAGLVEETFVRPDDAEFRVGVHRFEGPTVSDRPGWLFTFVR